MNRTETVELTLLCLVRKGNELLLQDRVKDDWRGFALPGGHVEPGESIVEAVKREMKEETGLTILEPKLCGVKHFSIENGRYLVFLFCVEEFSGELRSSDEGKMHWVCKEDLPKINAVADFDKLLEVMLSDNLTEFQYILENEDWKAIIR